MDQADRDRLVVLRKVKRRQITQREAAAELGLSVRQIKRLSKALKEQGDRAATCKVPFRPTDAGRGLKRQPAEQLQHAVAKAPAKGKPDGICYEAG